MSCADDIIGLTGVVEMFAKRVRRAESKAGGKRRRCCGPVAGELVRATATRA